VFQPLRRQFFRKMIRFLDKHLRVGQLQDVAPFISGEIVHTVLPLFADGLGSLPEEDGSLTQKLITEYSTQEILGSLRLTVFSTQHISSVVSTLANPRTVQKALDDRRSAAQERFTSLFVKEMLIKLIAGLVKERPETYFSEELVDFKRIEPSQVFLSLVAFLKETLR